MPDPSSALPRLERATDADIPAIVALMNRAYRGSGADAGWSTETAFIDGDRIGVTQLRVDVARRPTASLLVWRGESDQPIGCVWLEPEGEGCWYLGSLAVAPGLQDQGRGRRLLEAAEQWAIARGANAIRMTVVNVRTSLIAWYERRGYSQTGATEPFPYHDDRFGRPRRADLHFLVLTKSLLRDAR